jgi:hypothetical protein
MGWELRDFHLEQTGGLACPFQFELLIATSGKPSQVVRGDGVMIRERTVRLNRVDQLMRQAQLMGLSPEGFLASLQQVVTEQARGTAEPAA